ncbi:unnamed protein product [Didymodactylos carnosus]|uniref:Uncharacterized protein n=1 Tax=Didymodactylos carnosus TaxID=1234261 RepID=A0A813PP50_9BILA|nr:unnamed protein product [Didymodactylos carnosus]CAF0820714.1 unnamed protein product [Didymodactylos carnosus]CAF3533304.1 unnamed protein product [Didymodactylos carnosus]CAF3605007.1 unnamed protein product [Didymodactylos carnosus]
MFFKNKPVTSYLIGSIIGIILCTIGLILHLIAYFTPHWKEVIPNSNALYVDGIDALIRTEVLHYFNAVHRYTKHSYGLFRRCERLLNSTNTTPNILKEHQNQLCTKNYLPSYEDVDFNECHSLQYYRFCTKKNEKIFDIQNHYLLQTFAIDQTYFKENHQNSLSSCDCKYPTYVPVCQYFCGFGVIFIVLTIILYAWLPLTDDKKIRVRIKFIGVISSLLSIVFLMSNLIIMNNYLRFESLEYLVAIERHYRTNQIYKLSEDTRIAVNRFESYVIIKTGYSMGLEWIAFFLTIISAIILLGTCNMSAHKEKDKNTKHSLRESTSLNRRESIIASHHSVYV